MANFFLPYFGHVDLTTLEEYYNVEIDLNHNKVNLDLNFENKSIDQNAFQIIRAFLENINQYNTENKSMIENDFKEKGEAFDYINFYFDELDQDELSKIININDKNIAKEEQLLSKLKLIRIGLYPDGKYGADYFGVFDYSIDIDGEPCNQLLVVKTSENGNLDHMTWES